MTKVLVICDDFWHPGEVVKRGLSPLAKHGIDLDFVMDAKDILSKDMLPDYDVIMVCKGDALTSANSKAPWFETGVTQVAQEDFCDYVENGGGYIAMHAGNCFNHNKGRDMGSLNGNTFLGHPPQCTVEAKMINTSHPIVKGISDFSIWDEHYRIDVSAEDIEILFNTVSESEAGTQTAGYVRQAGTGRVCVLTPGHNLSVLSNVQYSKIIANSIKWCAKEL